jgi:hypothetical protein
MNPHQGLLNRAGWYFLRQLFLLTQKSHNKLKDKGKIRNI